MICGGKTTFVDSAKILLLGKFAESKMLMVKKKQTELVLLIEFGSLILYVTYKNYEPPDIPIYSRVCRQRRKLPG